jgi:hypothetical protein
MGVDVYLRWKGFGKGDLKNPNYKKQKELFVRELPDYPNIIDEILDVLANAKLNYFEIIGLLEMIKTEIKLDLIKDEE